MMVTQPKLLNNQGIPNTNMLQETKFAAISRLAYQDYVQKFIIEQSSKLMKKSNSEELLVISNFELKIKGFNSEML